MEKSIWEIERTTYPYLSNNKSYDILIIGGGLTGISMCYYLKDTGYNVCLIEQNKLLSSTTLKTTAKLTYLQQDTLSKIKKAYNEKTANSYLTSQIEAINNIKNIIDSESINCNLEKNDSYLFAIDKKNEKK